MTYTAEQLREWAEQIDGVSSPRPNTETIAEHYRAFADALEENARLRAERDTSVAVTERIKVALQIRGTGSYVEWAAYCRDALEKLDAALSAAKAEAEVADIWREKAKRAEAELAKLRQHAEAMAEGIESSHLEIEQEALAAYRADFPEEK